MTDPLDLLKQVAAKIGATRVDILIGQATPMGTTFGPGGIIHEAIGLTAAKNVLCYRGRAIVIYIKDHSYQANTKFRQNGAGHKTPGEWLLKNPREGNRYHLAPCKKILEMVEQKRFGRYVGGSEVILDKRGKPIFPIDLGKSLPEIKAALNLCSYCKDQIRQEPRNLKDWLAKNSKTIQRATQFPLVPQFTALTAPPNHYTPDWHNISWSYRYRQNWRCEICKKNCENNLRELHTHHKNMQKGDNRDSNLQALCETCHRKQHPGNPHFYIPHESS